MQMCIIKLQYLFPIFQLSIPPEPRSALSDWVSGTGLVATAGEQHRPRTSPRAQVYPLRSTQRPLQVRFQPFCLPGRNGALLWSPLPPPIPPSSVQSTLTITLFLPLRELWDGPRAGTEDAVEFTGVDEVQPS